MNHDEAVPHGDVPAGIVLTESQGALVVGRHGDTQDVRVPGELGRTTPAGCDPISTRRVREFLHTAQLLLKDGARR